jgi:renin receptor
MSFDGLVAAHSKSSPAVKEAKKLLFKALDNLQTSVEKAYKGSVLVGVVATNGEFIRSKRQAEPTPTDTDDNPLNLAPIYSPDYPVIFNIILWFSIVLVFSLLAISIAICTMDPGRDSIIYRMTSTRMKKDN